MNPKNYLTPSRMIMDTRASFDSRNHSNMTTNTIKADDIPNKAPHIKNFELYLPYACQIFHVDVKIEIIKLKQIEAVPAKSPRTKQSKKNVEAKKQESNVITQSSSVCNFGSASVTFWSPSIRIFLTLDANDDLIQIKFDKTSSIPKELVTILGFMLPFYPFLERIIIGHGADASTIYELGKVLQYTSITEICFDDAVILEANYDILLEECKNLLSLSLSRCKLNDHVIENIATKLDYGHRASFTLSVLNLSSNRLTDVAAKALARVLRKNRRLMYLNLADNSITDIGAEAILRMLYKFFLTIEEQIDLKMKRVAYLRRRQRMFDEYLTSQAVSLDVKEHKTLKHPNFSLVKTKRTSKMVLHKKDHYPEIMRRISEWVDAVCGDFEHIFANDTFCDDGVKYCNGNNVLAGINLAYNKISIFTLKMIVKVLRHQRELVTNNIRKSVGLVRVNVEGNKLPTECAELAEIDRLILIELNKKNPISKKPTQRRLSTVSKK